MAALVGEGFIPSGSPQGAPLHDIDPPPVVGEGLDPSLGARKGLLYIAMVLPALAMVAVPVFGQCPPPDSVEVSLGQLDLTGAYRTQELGQEPPWSLYKKAAERKRKVVIDRSGKLGQAVMMIELPIEDLWMAINDEDHYADGGYLPVQHSEVIDGTSRGQQRVLFQYFKRAGVGRWWIDEVVMNEELFEDSAGMLWELRWWDLMETHGDSGLPAEFSDLGLSPIQESRGAWLLIPFGEHCTLIEYVTISDPGGLLGLAHLLASGRVIRETLEGVERLAREHIPEPHTQDRFLRPDGSVIERGF